MLCFHPWFFVRIMQRNYWMDFHKTQWKDGTWAKKELSTFWFGSWSWAGSRVLENSLLSCEMVCFIDNFRGNNLCILMTKTRHIFGADMYECVQFGAHWFELRGLLGLGRDILSTECHYSLIVCSYCAETSVWHEFSHCIICFSAIQHIIVYNMITTTSHTSLLPDRKGSNFIFCHHSSTFLFSVW